MDLAADGVLAAKAALRPAYGGPTFFSHPVPFMRRRSHPNLLLLGFRPKLISNYPSVLGKGFRFAKLNEH